MEVGRVEVAWAVEVLEVVEEHIEVVEVAVDVDVEELG